MKIYTSLFLAVTILLACKSSKNVRPICSNPCLKDTLKFSTNYPLKPYVYISAKNCLPDSIIWSYEGMGVNKKSGLADLINYDATLDKDMVHCYINDTAYAWVLFNDCKTGRGFQLRLPFNKTGNIGLKSSGINNLDPKFSVDETLLAYTDRGNIYVEDMVSGKKAMMTFGKALDIDYDNIHKWIDSVHVTPDRIWVKVKIDGDWKELEKNIKLE